MRIRFARSSTKHRVSRARSLYVVESAEEWFDVTPPSTEAPQTERRRLYLGADRRGELLEVIAIEIEDGSLLVIHAMRIRKRFREWVEEV